MDNLPGVRAEPSAAADYSGDGGPRTASILPDMPAGNRPEYRERPERQAPEPMIYPIRGWIVALAFFVCPEVIARARRLGVSDSDTEGDHGV